MFLVAAVALGQSPEQSRTFTFTQQRNPQQLQEVANAIRSIAMIQQAAIDPQQQSITAAGDASQVDLMSWIVLEVDKPSEPAPETLLIRVFTLPDSRDSAVRVFRPVRMRTPVQLQETVNTIRSIAEPQRVVVVTSPGAIVLRGSPEQAAFAEWIVRELDQSAPGATHEYVVPGWNDGVARTFFLAPDLSGAEIQKKVNEVRTRAGIERTIGIAYPPAIVVRGTREQVAAAGKLLR